MSKWNENVDKKCGEDDKYDVQFIENEKLGDVSVIPTNWLVGEHRCGWPTNSRITRTLIIECHVPNSDWSQMIVKFTIFMIPMPRLSNMKKKLAASYESKGDQEQQPGKRRIKQKKLLQNMHCQSTFCLFEVIQ
ncbi:hypothetical protein JTB14_033364 [Gonioctena quinquepunctata]|nr:hypothetical protein JTB14_033364 [Gonioctena quinquepunctata]